MAIPVKHVNGIGPKTVEYLATKGIVTVSDFLNAGPASIEDAPGFSPGRAEQAYAAALSIGGRAADTSLETAPAVEPAPKKAKQGKSKKKDKKEKKSKDKDEKKKKDKKDKKSKKSDKKKKKKSKNNK
ncbi:MAG: hypothetical protein C0631_04145 [Sedimenticola sp.]|nr:MAG: hypothetical protein C0631_04145 [Sedimenticola sp.]